MVLIVTNEKDVTSDYIVRELQKRNSPYYRLNTERIGNGVNVYLDLYNRECYIYDDQKNETIDIADIQSIYYRRPVLPAFDNYDINEGEKRYLQSEVFYLLEGIYKLLRDRYWMNPLFKLREAENKIFQLVLAERVGLMIPHTCYTNIPKNAKQFILSQRGAITKPIKSGHIEASDKIIYTNKVTDEALKTIDSIQGMPVCLQEEINKVADIRVTVVGKSVFTAKIEYDEDLGRVIDWRKSKYTKQRYSKFSLPDDIYCKVLNLNKLMGLRYSAMDFALKGDGNLVFLENNPNGQWAWIQNQLGMNIAGEIVTALQGGKKCVCNSQFI